MQDREGYVWVLLTKYGDRVYVHGIYTTYYELQASISDIEAAHSQCEIYDYEQIPID